MSRECDQSALNGNTLYWRNEVMTRQPFCWAFSKQCCRSLHRLCGKQCQLWLQARTQPRTKKIYR